jgi:hypothetical protein
MKIESNPEYFDSPSIIGIILRKLHIDIPLFIGLMLAAILSFVILYSTGDQDLSVLVRQGARVGLAFALMTALALPHPHRPHHHHHRRASSSPSSSSSSPSLRSTSSFVVTVPSPFSFPTNSFAVFKLQKIVALNA